MNLCFNCGKETSNKKFCSRSCSASTNNKTPKRIKSIWNCKLCGTPGVKRNGAICVNCREIKDITLADAIYKHLHRSSAFALVRSRARTLLKDAPQVCITCGYDKHVEVCHIKPISSFTMDTLLSEINHLSNLKLLCPNCHWEFDNIQLS